MSLFVSVKSLKLLKFPNTQVFKGVVHGEMDDILNITNIFFFWWTDNQIAAIQPRAVDAAGSLHPCLALLLVAAVVAEALCHSTN